MAAQIIKYRMLFKDRHDVDYRLDIYGENSGYDPDMYPIMLIPAGDSPLVINEDDSDDFYTPVRSQTGSIKVCTETEEGYWLELWDILPENNTSNPIRLYRNGEAIWFGYLGCEMYDQTYVGVPEMIELKIISELEATKYKRNDGNFGLITINYLLERIYPYTRVFPQDGADVLNKYINCSIFVQKKEFINEEAHTYKLEGSSYYSILETICKFMGWTCRQVGTAIHFELLQGRGLANTVQRNMNDVMVWVGTGHRRSIRQGVSFLQVTSKLSQLDIDTSIPDMPFGDFACDSYRQVGEPSAYYRPWVYLLASSDLDAYSNLDFHFYHGEYLMTENAVVFSNMDSRASLQDVIDNCIPVANDQSSAYKALGEFSESTDIYAGACLARMEIDSSNIQQHQNTKDGLFMSLFPGVWQQHTTYNNPIFEMRSNSPFAAAEDGYFNLRGKLLSSGNDWSMFTAELVSGLSNPDIQMLVELQVGDKVWDNSLRGWATKTPTSVQTYFFVGFDSTGKKWYVSNMAWNDQMGIDQVDGLCIPTFDAYGTSGVDRVAGDVVLRIYPQTKITDTQSSLWRRRMIFDLFFESIELSYIPKKNVDLSDRSDNTYRTNAGAGFDGEVNVENDIASWLNNNSSASLLFNGSDWTPMQTLTYYKSNGTTEQRRPETDLLRRMKAFYSKPRTILSLEAEHNPGGVPLTQLKLTGIDDDKVYAPLAESWNVQKDVSTITCIEIPQ